MEDHGSLAHFCRQLDKACPQYEFFYTGGPRNRAICVYRRDGGRETGDKVATIECPEHDRDYVATKIILQFSGGTIPA